MSLFSDLPSYMCVLEKPRARALEPAHSIETAKSQQDTAVSYFGMYVVTWAYVLKISSINPTTT